MSNQAAAAIAPVQAPKRDSGERALVLAARNGGERARAEFVDAFLPRIAGLAREYRFARSVNRDELMQAGVLGLLRALRRYDTARKNQFWTYARWWVRQAMQEVVSSLENAVAFSDRALRQLARINAARRDCLQSSRCEPSTRDLAAMTGLPRTQIARLVAASLTAHTLDAPVDGNDEGPRPLGETLRDPAGEDAFDLATLRVAARALPAALSTLAPRELAIVRGRYGIDGNRRSLNELSAELCVSSERVRQIEQVAMRKLRASCDATFLPPVASAHRSEA